MPSEHALLSASGAHIWLNCPPSASLSALMPDQESDYAREGTLAHSVHEELLNYLRRQNVDYVPQFEDIQTAAEGLGGLHEALKPIKEDAKREGFDFDDMLSYAWDSVAIIWEDYLVSKREDPETEIHVEVRLDLSHFIPEGFGTCDALIIGGSILHIYDFKYGKGLKVEAVRNPQMMIYAIGALMGPAEPWYITLVTMSIHQPRLRNTSSWTESDEALMAWGRNTLKPTAEIAFLGKGSITPGDHCRFCKAKPRCLGMAKHAVNLQKTDDPKLLSYEEVGELLGQLDAVVSWAEGVRNYALSVAMAGETIPGWKVVEGPSRRRISRTAEAVAALCELGWDADQCYKPRELKTISELEKMVGKKNFGAILGQYVEKPAGKPTLARDDDDRPAVDSVKSDFEK